MLISSVNIYNQTFFNPCFGVNLNSKKLKFKEDDFYVRIKGYGHHSGWAKKARETADNAVKLIRESCNFEETLKNITNGIREANQLPSDRDKRMHTGILRTEREGWRHGSEWDGRDLITRYGKNANVKYVSYTARFDHIVQYPLTNPYMIDLTRPVHDKDFGKYLRHGSARSVNKTFYYVKKIFDDLCSKYILQEIKPENMYDVNNSIAEIRWLLAHATPWERGSDAISNTFIRSIYKAMGIKTSPLKKGISLDLEAYCTNLKDYKAKFETYFVKKPYVVE